jgi:anti-sigma factor RsiW
MDCRQTRDLLHVYLDQELDPVRQLGVEEHLARCAACAQARESAGALAGALRARTLYHPAPAGLERAVLKATRRAAGPRWARWSAAELGFASVAAAMVVLALVAGVMLGRSSARTDPAQEVVASHIRSLMPGHLIDELSSDHHTLKPWFAGRLDFSPPVPDLGSAGFALAGARLDYLGGRPVAAVVFRRRLHVINLFVWPTAPGEATARLAGSVQGYNYVRFAAGSSTCWAVSDLNASELDGFIRLVQAAG